MWDVILSNCKDVKPQNMCDIVLDTNFPRVTQKVFPIEVTDIMNAKKVFLLDLLVKNPKINDDPKKKMKRLKELYFTCHVCYDW